MIFVVVVVMSVGVVLSAVVLVELVVVIRAAHTDFGMGGQENNGGIGA